MNVNEINLESLRLNMDNYFLSVPNLPTTNDNEKITVTAQVVDINGDYLSNTQIFISDSISGNLNRVKIYDADQNNEIPIITQDNKEGFLINTDGQGKILFFIKPYQSLPVILNLYSNVTGSTKLVAAKHTVFIVNNSLDSMETKFDQPQILNFFGENLKSDGDSKFEVDIPNYDKKKLGDYILLFVNEEYTNYYIRVEDQSNAHIFTKLPYGIFKKDIYSNFFYVLIRDSGDIIEEKSNALPLTYKGRPNKPWTDVYRTYEQCKVYSSGGALVNEDYDVINDATIAEQNPENAGLFVKITGTNDPNDNSKVPFGANITLNMYINSSTRTVTKSYNQTMQTHPDDIGGKTATLKISIDHSDIKNNMGYEDGTNGHIFFDYQIGDDTDLNVTYGKVWKSEIDTDPYA
ncbi:conserved protein of unknown function [Xenorhabdus poinarii G6]|uniref:Uncharacterized protein n=1 Tax=Xenorhabdus poinarii G6 TaxID=1354304 RepID=A0A068QXT2_9GAMM|nr:hypothetical protein [Xenorhabdus poinarii]CDG19822.1 conserved protein of unknown function [Xenorhabdus poinarii G6]